MNKCDTSASASASTSTGKIGDERSNTIELNCIELKMWLRKTAIDDIAFRTINCSVVVMAGTYSSVEGNRERVQCIEKILVQKGIWHI